MTFGILGAILGAIFGLWRAKKAGGDGADMAQYALVFALIFGIIGVILAVIVVRNA